MASVFNIGEFRIVNKTTTFSTGFVVADSTAVWMNSSAYSRIACLNVPDLSGLVDQGLEDTTLKTRLHRRPANIQAIQSTALTFTTYLEGGQADGTVTVNNVGKLLASCMCKESNAISPADNTKTVTATSTTTTIESDAHGATTGSAALLGTRGDGRGDGEVRVTLAGNDANDFTVNMATLTLMDSPDAIVLAQTVYASPTHTDFDYIDSLYIGHDADSPDQYQTIGGVLTFELAGMAPGELPTVNWTLQSGAWQVVASGDKSTDLASTDPAWNAPAGGGLALGGLFLQDASSTVRNTYQVANVTITPGFTFVPILDPNGINGMGGFVKVPSAPTVEFDVLFGDVDAMPGLLDDYEAQTAKQALFQWGATIEKTCAIDFQRLFIDAAPTRIEVNGLSGAHVVAHGECAESPSGTDVEDAAMRIHTM